MSPGTYLAVAIGGFFLYAASFKAIESSALRHTLQDLGISERIAPRAARLIPAFEVAVVIVVLSPTSRGLAGSLVALAALGIGTAGVLARRLPDPIPCSCFSQYSSRSLGGRQVVMALAMASAAAGLVTTAHAPDLELSMLLLVGASCAALAAHLILATGTLRTNVRLRRWASDVHPA